MPASTKGKERHRMALREHDGGAAPGTLGPCASCGYAFRRWPNRFATMFGRRYSHAQLLTTVAPPAFDVPFPRREFGAYVLPGRTTDHRPSLKQAPIGEHIGLAAFGSSNAGRIQQSPPYSAPSRREPRTVMLTRQLLAEAGHLVAAAPTQPRRYTACSGTASWRHIARGLTYAARMLSAAADLGISTASPPEVLSQLRHSDAAVWGPPMIENQPK
jgi:hypothetical protein